MAGPNTPQANRAPSNAARVLRNSFEDEIWDDNASIVFEATDLTGDTIAAGAGLTVCNLEVGTPVPSRFEISAQVRATSGSAVNWTATVRNGGVLTDTSSQAVIWPAGFSELVAFKGTIDVEPGLYTLDIRIEQDAASNSADFYNKRLIVRRGRKPSTV